MGTVLAFADDMTGALEVGAKFSHVGIAAVVSTRPMRADSAQVLVFDTESRHLTPGDAAQTITRFLEQAEQPSPSLVYKKTDSVLRGNISAELQALVQFYPDWRIGFAPAYPAMGRTVKHGVLHVDGVPVAETEFARDSLNPIQTSLVSAILHPTLDCRIFDADTDAHLAEAARTILSNHGMRIAAGPAGLAEAIARMLDFPRTAPPALPTVGTCLILNGSRHERSNRQLRQAEAPGWRVLHGEHPAVTNAAEVARENGRFAVERICEEDPDAIFVIGGDTAFAVVEALGSPCLSPIAEAEPGVPVTRIEAVHLAHLRPCRNRDLILITKAGGFGPPDVLSRVRAKLSNDRPAIHT